MKITVAQHEAACAIAAQVYKKDIRLADGVRALADKYGINKNSAKDFIDDYRHLARGENFQRAMSGAAMLHFMTQVGLNEGLEGERNAVRSLQAHIAYYEKDGKTTHMMRGVLSEFLKTHPAAAVVLSPTSQLSTSPNNANSGFPKYTGKPVPDWVEDFFQTIRELGFTVSTSDRGRASTSPARRTLCIEWRGVYVAYTHHNLWRHRRYFGYRFNPGQKNATSVVPPDFDLNHFCRVRSLSPHQFTVYSEKSGSYLQVSDEAAAIRLLVETVEDLDGDVSAAMMNDALQAEEDVTTVRHRNIPETTKKRLIDARLGQGGFRADLMVAFRRRCAVSGLMLESALRASHIIPWRSSSDEERLDPENGVLLSANLDALFDRYLISFTKEGALVRSCLLNDVDVAKLGPLADLSARPTPARAKYLESHREMFEGKEKVRAGRQLR